MKIKILSLLITLAIGHQHILAHYNQSSQFKKAQASSVANYLLPDDEKNELSSYPAPQNDSHEGAMLYQKDHPQDDEVVSNYSKDEEHPKHSAAETFHEKQMGYAPVEQGHKEGQYNSNAQATEPQPQHKPSWQETVRSKLQNILQPIQDLLKINGPNVDLTGLAGKRTAQQIKALIGTEEQRGHTLSDIMHAMGDTMSSLPTRVANWFKEVLYEKQNGVNFDSSRNQLKDSYNYHRKRLEQSKDDMINELKQKYKAQELQKKQEHTERMRQMGVVDGKEIAEQVKKGYSPMPLRTQQQGARAQAQQEHQAALTTMKQQQNMQVQSMESSWNQSLASLEQQYGLATTKLNKQIHDEVQTPHTTQTSENQTHSQAERNFMVDNYHARAQALADTSRINIEHDHSFSPDQTPEQQQYISFKKHQQLNDVEQAKQNALKTAGIRRRTTIEQAKEQLSQFGDIEMQDRA